MKPTVVPVLRTRVPMVRVAVAPRPEPLCELTYEAPVFRVTVPTVSVVVAGPLPALAVADPLTAIVDAAGKGPGAYPVDVVVRASGGATVQTVQPGRVTLTIRTR